MEIDNAKALASVAHESGAYDESYKYHTKILEMDAGNADAWVKKGVAAAFLSNSHIMKGMEAKICILKGIELGASDAVKNAASISLRAAYNNFFNRLNDELHLKILDHQKIAMPNGGSPLIHMASQSLNKILAAKALAPARIDGIELIVAMCASTPNQETYRLGVTAIGNLIEHARQNGDYLKNANDALPQIQVNGVREALIKEAESIYPGFRASLQQSSTQPPKSGCFIATAAAGDYNHPQVLILRSLRDEVISMHEWGRSFVKYYYKLSPPIAKAIAASPPLRVGVMLLIVKPIAYLAFLYLSRNTNTPR